MMRTAGILALALAGGILAAPACGKKAAPRTLVGTWHVMVDDKANGDVWTFMPNGAFSESSPGQDTETGTWAEKATKDTDSLDVELDSGDNVGVLKLSWEGNDAIGLTGKSIDVKLKR